MSLPDNSIAQTLSVSVKNITAMCQKGHLPPYPTPFANVRKHFCQSPQCKTICKPVGANFHPTNSTRRACAQSTSNHVLQGRQCFLLLCGAQPSSLCLFRVKLYAFHSPTAFCYILALSHATVVCPRWNYQLRTKFAFPSCHSSSQSQGHLFNWFCKRLATKFTTAAEVGSTVTATGWEKVSIHWRKAGHQML